MNKKPQYVFLENVEKDVHLDTFSPFYHEHSNGNALANSVDPYQITLNRSSLTKVYTDIKPTLF